MAMKIPSTSALSQKVFAGTQTKSDNYTMTAADVGRITFVGTDAKVMTLPAVSAANKGWDFTFINSGADAGVLLSISPASTDYVYYITGVDNKDLLNTKATAIKGDMVTIVSDGVDGWWVTAIKGTWAKEA